MIVTSCHTWGRFQAAGDPQGQLLLVQLAAAWGEHPLRGPRPHSRLIYSFHVYIFKCSHSILQLCASIWDHFPSELPVMFLVVQICWQQILSAVFNRKHLYLSFDFEGFFCWIQNIGLQGLFVFLQHLKMLIFRFLTSVVPVEMSVISPFDAHLEVLSLLFQVCEDCQSVFSFQKFDRNVPSCVLFVWFCILFQVYRASRMYSHMCFNQFGEILSQYFFQYCFLYSI